LLKAKVGLVNCYEDVTRVNYISVFEKKKTEKDRKMGKFSHQITYNKHYISATILTFLQRQLLEHCSCNGLT